MPTLILTKTFPGSASVFRAQMQRLFNLYKGKEWVSSSGERLVFGERRQTIRELVSVTPAGEISPGVRTLSEHRSYRTIDVTPPERTTWQVSKIVSVIEDDTKKNTRQGYAAIEAYEQAGLSTQVDFLDGYHSTSPVGDREPIGSSFEEFTKWVIREVWPTQVTEPTAAQDDEADTSEVDYTKLRQILDKRFNASELRTFCADLNVDYDDLPGESKTDKVRELVGYYERRDNILELVEACKEQRPKAPWSKVMS